MGITIAITIYLRKHQSDVDKNASLMAFPPFLAVICLSPLLINLYAIFEFDTLIFNPSDAYAALEKHGFISLILKCFVAGTAICIAWHRSLVTEYQNKMKRESDNLTNYLSLQELCIELLYKETDKANVFGNKNLCRAFFNNIFNDPAHGDYSPKEDTFLHFHKINDLLKELPTFHQDVYLKFEWTFRQEIMVHIIGIEERLGFRPKLKAPDIDIGDIDKIVDLSKRVIKILNTCLEIVPLLPIKNENKIKFNNILRSIGTTNAKYSDVIIAINSHK
jgi:hypothetical protein